jgi:CheY-like chemotaxis protein
MGQRPDPGSGLPIAPPSPLAPLALIADDSAVVRLTLARRLRAEGFEVIAQESATRPEAKTFARLACAILDLDLGASDGATFAQSLRQERAGLPIAFFSGTASGELLERARALGPVFAKPGELDAAVAWACASSR